MATTKRYKVNIKYIVTVILMIYSFNGFCQDIYEGKIIDSRSKVSLPWVNIGIIGKNVGTVSNEMGDFEILFNEKHSMDTLRISMLGYKSLVYKVNDFKGRILLDPIFQLQEELVQLDEVVISNRIKRAFVLGNTEFTNTMVFGFQSNELGNEIGTIVKVEDGPVTIETINVNIYKNKLKRFKFRLNIYNLKEGRPNKNVLNENIIIECTLKKGEYAIDVSSYNITADEDIFVSLEWIENASKEQLYFSTTPEGSKTFTRHASQAYWVEAKNVSLGLNIGVKY